MSLEDASVDELIPLNLLMSFKGHSQMRGTTFHRRHFLNDHTLNVWHQRTENTCASVYLRQNWSNMKYSWLNYAFISIINLIYEFLFAEYMYDKYDGIILFFLQTTMKKHIVILKWKRQRNLYPFDTLCLQHHLLLIIPFKLSTIASNSFCAKSSLTHLLEPQTES